MPQPPQLFGPELELEKPTTHRLSQQAPSSPVALVQAEPAPASAQEPASPVAPEELELATSDPEEEVPLVVEAAEPVLLLKADEAPLEVVLTLPSVEAAEPRLPLEVVEASELEVPESRVEEGVVLPVDAPAPLAEPPKVVP